MRKIFMLLVIIIYSQVLLSQYKLVEKDAVASCFSYAIHDVNDNEVILPGKFDQILDCPSMIDIHGNILTYEYKGIRQYNLETGTDKLLFQNFDDIDGCSGPAWSADGKKVMFVIINQQMKHNYNAMCRIIILTLDDNYDITEKRKFDRNVNFSCGSICTSVPGEDFYFINNSKIAYREHNIDNEDFDIKEISF